MSLYRDEGVVLRTIRLGEADRIVTLVTKEHGKVRAVAKGIRRTKSRIGARLEPLSHVTMLCWQGRELDVVNQVEVVESFRHVRSDLNRLNPAMTMLEVVDHVAMEHHAAPELFTLLTGALRSLDTDGSPLVLGAFCWKLLSIEGVAPITERCAHCNKDVPLVAFDSHEGGFLCRDCRRGQPVSQEVVELVRRVLGGQLRAALDEPVGPATAMLERLGTTAIEHHIDRRLRSVPSLPDVETRGA